MDEKQRLLKLQEDLEEMTEIYKNKFEFHKENIKKNLEILEKIKKG